ncbi:phage major capsid protein [Bradyrhizobium sp. LB11.1]|uniref:phage major capsid protein n=1 Tax=Bradyrhizobium sp. LB11.1 TaxID=3156326 RepID=UPI003399E4AC
MTFHTALETKSATELSDEAGVTEIKTALDNLTKDVNAKTAPVADLEKRLAAAEAKLARPAIHTKVNTDEAKELESKALDHYFRKYGTGEFNADEVKAMSAGSNADGGYTVPQTFVAEIIKTITQFSPMRELARITQVGGSPVILPRRLTKPTVGVKAETAADTGSSSTYGQWSVPVFEIREHVDISNQLIEDSAFDLGAEIGADLGESFGEKEGDLFFNGAGTTEPLGLLNDTDFVTATSASTTITADDLIDLYYGVKTAYSKNGAWGMNRKTIATVRKFKSSVGEYLWQESLADGQPPTFLGKPVVEIPALQDPAAGAVVAVFGDWFRGFRVLDRIGMSVLPDRLTQASNGQVRYHARRRMGGKLVQPEALIGLKVHA